MYLIRSFAMSSMVLDIACIISVIQILAFNVTSLSHGRCWRLKGGDTSAEPRAAAPRGCQQRSIFEVKKTLRYCDLQPI
jgi:hypothetical protein